MISQHQRLLIERVLSEGDVVQFKQKSPGSKSTAQPGPSQGVVGTITPKQKQTKRRFTAEEEKEALGFIDRSMKHLHQRLMNHNTGNPRKITHPVGIISGYNIQDAFEKHLMSSEHDDFFKNVGDGVLRAIDHHTGQPLYTADLYARANGLKTTGNNVHVKDAPIGHPDLPVKRPLQQKPTRPRLTIVKDHVEHDLSVVKRILEQHSIPNVRRRKQPTTDIPKPFGPWGHSKPDNDTDDRVVSLHPHAKQFKTPEDFVSHFVDHNIVQHDRGSETTTGVYERYCMHHELHNPPHACLSYPAFNRVMSDHGYVKSLLGGRARYIGIKLTPENQDM